MTTKIGYPAEPSRFELVPLEKKPWMPRRLRDSPFWLVALLFHATLLFAFAFWTVIIRPTAPTDLTGQNYIAMQEPAADPIFTPPSPPNELRQEFPQNPQTRGQNNPHSPVVIASYNTGPEFAEFGSHSISNPAREFHRTIPGPLGERIKGPAGHIRLVPGPNSENVEEATVAALKWLHKKQNADGSWGEDYKSAMTGFALLCYLAHGDIQGTPEYGVTVEKGIHFLIQEGDSHDGLMGSDRKVEYQHAIASLALAENYAMVPTLADVERAAKRSIQIIVHAQQADGSYAYGYATTGGHADTSVGGWNYQALEAAHLALLEVEGIPEALAKGANYLKNCFNESHRTFGYANANDLNVMKSWERRGMGAYNLQLILDPVTNGKREWEKTAAVTKSLEALIKDDGARADWQKARGAVLYGWYYNTYMAHCGGGAAWQYWQPQFRQTLLKNQLKDGHWPLPPGDELAQHLPKPGDAEIFSTTLCCLMLQVYWRHLTT